MLNRLLAPQWRHFGLAILALIVAVPLLLLERSNGRYVEIADRPLYSMPSGNYPFPIVIDFAGAPLDAEITYTLNGRDPIAGGIRYQKPFALPDAAVTVIRARYQAADGSWSEVANATYIVGLETSLPVLSIIADPASLREPEVGVLANPAERGREWEIPVDLMFFEGDRSDAAGQLAFVSPAGLRIHGSASRGYPKQSLRLYFRDEYGNGRLDYPLYAGRTSLEPIRYDRLVLHSGAQDYAFPESAGNWTLLRASLLYELAAEVGAYTAQSRPALLFVNGRPEGIFQLRTAVDETYLQDRYGLDVQQLFTISGDPGSPNALFESGESDAAAKREWLELLRFLETNDLQQPAVFDQLQTKVDIDNLIDYVILQFYIGNTDWLLNNVRQFRTESHNRWSWVLWDVDYGFGLAPWSDVETNMLDWLYQTDRPGFAQGALLLRQLFEVEAFQQRYLTRLDELLRTSLAPEHVSRRLQNQAAEIRPDIEFETNLWGSPGSWEASVREMEEFVQQRPQILREHHEAYFGEFP